MSSIGINSVFTKTLYRGMFLGTKWLKLKVTEPVVRTYCDICESEGRDKTFADYVCEGCGIDLCRLHALEVIYYRQSELCGFDFGPTMYGTFCLVCIPKKQKIKW